MQPDQDGTIPLPIAAHFYDMFDHRDRIGCVHRPAPSFVGFDKSNKNLEHVGCQRAQRGAHKSVDRLQRRIIVGLISDRLYVQDQPSSPSTHRFGRIRHGFRRTARIRCGAHSRSARSAIPVPADIGNDPVAGDDVRFSVNGFDVCGRGPVGFRHDRMPGPQGLFRTLFFLPVVP